MKTIQQRNSLHPLAASLATLLTTFAGAVLMLGTQLSAFAADTEPSAPHDVHKMEHDWARHRQEWMKKRLDKAAERLAIQPSQQEAWQAYVNAVESPVGHAGKPAEESTDAADATSIARHRADVAAMYAARMMDVADATASLQSVLTPEQQQKFNRMVAHAHHAPFGRHAGHRALRDDMSHDQPAHQ